MSLKIRFYAAVINEEKEEINWVEFFKKEEQNGYSIYCIQAGEICSEFIARYFYKTKNIPKLLLNNVIEENYTSENCEAAKQDMYKINVNKMIQDNKENFEFRVYKECKIVRKKLLEKYEEIDQKVRSEIENSKIEMFAVLTI